MICHRSVLPVWNMCWTNIVFDVKLPILIYLRQCVLCVSTMVKLLTKFWMLIDFDI